MYILCDFYVYRWYQVIFRWLQVIIHMICIMISLWLHSDCIILSLYLYYVAYVFNMYLIRWVKRVAWLLAWQLWSGFHLTRWLGLHQHESPAKKKFLQDSLSKRWQELSADQSNKRTPPESPFWNGQLLVCLPCNIWVIFERWLKDVFLCVFWHVFDGFFSVDILGDF